MIDNDDEENEQENQLDNSQIYTDVFDVRVSLDMSKEELFQVIESQKKEVRYLQQRIVLLEKEKDRMIENFQLSSSVLLERLKDLEAQTSGISAFGERPQTANVLSKLTAESNGKRIGQAINSIRGAKPKGKKQGSIQEENEEEDEEVSKKIEERVLCPNCKQIFSMTDMITHTVICYRNSSKCKMCGEVILKDQKKEHLKKWRNLEKLKEEIINDNEQQASLFFDHGVDCNIFFPNDPEGWTPMHYAAKAGSLKVVIGLISRGAGVDPPDINYKTPLILAIEFNRFTVARSLIEFGADIEAKDSSQRTPLMFACKLGSKEMVELLLGYKADIKATNSLGDSCVSFAQKSGNPEIMGLLVKSGASIRPASRQASLKIPPQRGGSNLRLAPSNNNSNLRNIIRIKMMDLEEIKCPLCTQVYDESEKIPILLPDCGHSFCLSCIYECFILLKEDQEEAMANGNDPQSVNEILFRCPDDDVLCSIQNPDHLPKNYALLKIVQKTKESLENKNKKIVWLNYQEEEKKFIVQKPVDNSLAKFLTTPSQPGQLERNTSNSSNGSAPQDQYPLKKQPTIDANPSPLPPSLEPCKLHDRPLELICVDDRQRICAQCALFGNHKGHDVRMEDEVTKEISLKVEVLIEMYQAMELSCDELNNQENYDKQYNVYRQKQAEMKEKIQDKFKEWRKALRAIEMRAIDSLYQNYQQFEEKFTQAKNYNQKMIIEGQAWMDRAKQQLDEYTTKTTTNPFYIPYEMLDAKTADDVLNAGENLIDKFEKQKGYPSLNGLESSYSQVKLQFEPNFEKKLNGIAKVFSTTSAAGGNEFSGDFTTNSGSFLPPFSFHEEDERVKQETDALNLSNISFNEPGSPINQTTHTAIIEKQLEETKLDDPHYLKQQNPNNISQVSTLRRQSTTKAPATQNQLQAPGAKKKNDLPSAFKNDVMGGELDLSNRNLSDMHSNELAKCIRTQSGPIKQLNLSKNRISDEGINHIIKALCDSQIESVNLQGNKLSEKCVEGIVGSLKTNKTLKILDLSNNGIGSRLMKNKLKNALPQIEMPIDINLLRTDAGKIFQRFMNLTIDKGFDPEVVRKSERDRFRDPVTVDQIIEIDNEWRKLTYQVDQLKKEQNAISKQIGQRIKDSKGADKCEEEKKQSNEIKERIEAAEKQKDELTHLRNAKLNTIGNLVYSDVPISQTENDNAVVSQWGQVPELKIDGKTLGHLHHHEIMQCLDMVEFERGQKIAGHRGYFLKGVGVLLNQALINYGLTYLSAQDYTALQPPFFMKQSIMQETCQLSDFEENLYKVQGENEDGAMYLIATSEQPISALHRNEWIEPADLPKRYAGSSSCFRKEAGAHGKDVWGIFRVHQFEKIEQFCITTPENSWALHEEMIKSAERFYQQLELPYRVVNIVSKELNDAAAKKYDLEAWFPGYDTWRELVSCSNCTDYQSRGLEVRLALKNNKEKVYVHMLNATLCATERTMCCILENYQTPEGVRVPTVLQPFMGGKEFLPYNQKATAAFFERKEQEEKKLQQKQKKQQ